MTDTRPIHDGVRKKSHRSWLSNEMKQYGHWLNTAIETVIEAENFPSAVKELQILIESNPRYTALANRMYDEAYDHDVSSLYEPYCDSRQGFRRLLSTLNYLLTVPPQWSTQTQSMGVICCPIYLRLFKLMHTASGVTFFHDPQVNVIMKKVLEGWADFLRSPASNTYLTQSSGGWLSPQACVYLTNAANLPGDNNLRNFEEMYICEPSRPHYGFESWDHFFTRQFRDGVRPVAGFDNPSIITHTCEAIPWGITSDLKHEDMFWAEGTQYSLQDLLAHNDLSEGFIGGTLYRSWLTALSYHRWHAPVSGKIVEVVKVQGHYFAKSPDSRFCSEQTPIQQPIVDMTAIATRVVIYIEADNPDIGLVALVMIGVSEASSCEVSVIRRQRVTKGDEIGMFHFGGSLCCMLFRKEVDLIGLPDWSGTNGIMPVRGQLAQVRKRSARSRKISKVI